jgi:signal peptidase II
MLESVHVTKIQSRYRSATPRLAPCKLRHLKRSHILILVILVVVILDQWLKIYVKTNLSYGTGFDILGLSWAKIHFVENEGMAFGITFGDKCLGVTSDDGSCQGLKLTSESGKLILSVFRIIMVGFLSYFIIELHKAKESLGLLISLSMILAGAVGNIIDSAFYGIIFSSSPYHSGVAELFPEDGGYAPFLFGHVVDMFYFPLVDTRLPSWIPFFGGDRFEFFRPVFNVADASISVGVASILLFHRSFLKRSDAQKKKEGLAPPAESVSIESPDTTSSISDISASDSAT